MYCSLHKYQEDSDGFLEKYGIPDNENTLNLHEECLGISQQFDFPELKVHSSANSAFLEEMFRNPLVADFAEKVFRLWILETPGNLDVGANHKVPMGVWSFLHRQAATKD